MKHSWQWELSGCREAEETQWRRGDSDERLAVGRKVEIQGQQETQEIKMMRSKTK